MQKQKTKKDGGAARRQHPPTTQQVVCLCRHRPPAPVFPPPAAAVQPCLLVRATHLNKLPAWTGGGAAAVPHVLPAVAASMTDEGGGADRAHGREKYVHAGNERKKNALAQPLTKGATLHSDSPPHAAPPLSCGACRGRRAHAQARLR